MLTRKLFAIGFLGILLAGGLALAEEPKYGGTLKVALASEPGTLDMQLTTCVAASIPVLIGIGQLADTGAVEDHQQDSSISSYHLPLLTHIIL